MKIKLLIFFSVFLLLKANAQNSISGRIIDAGNHEALPGVNIIIHELSVGTVSNNKGQYQINKIPNGQFYITFSFVGYEDQTKKVDFQGHPVTMNIKLKPMAIQGQEVVVTGNFTGTQHPRHATHLHGIYRKCSGCEHDFKRAWCWHPCYPGTVTE